MFRVFWVSGLGLFWGLGFFGLRASGFFWGFRVFWVSGLGLF